MTVRAGCFAPAANDDDFGQSFPPRPRGRPSGRVPLEPPAFFNPSNGHPCPSPGGERPCSPKKGETGKSAFWGAGQVDKNNKGLCQQSEIPPVSTGFVKSPMFAGAADSSFTAASASDLVQDNPGVGHADAVRPGDDRVEVHLFNLRVSLDDFRDGHEQFLQGLFIHAFLASYA